jgi:hypothetical protein
MKLVKVTIVGFLDVEVDNPILKDYERVAYELHAGAGIVSEMKIEPIEVNNLDDLPNNCGEFFDYGEDSEE